VLPFVRYGGALPAFSADMLEEAMSGATLHDPPRLATMYDGQSAFLHDFAGPLDGMQFERVTAFVHRVLGL